MHRVSPSTSEFFLIRILKWKFMILVCLIMLMIPGFLNASLPLKVNSQNQDNKQKYLDLFNHPTDSWRRGIVTPSNKPGPLTLRNGDYITLSGTTVNPENLRNFEASLTWTFGKSNDGEIIIALGKPHEWSPIKDASVLIRIDQKGSVRIHEQKNNILKSLIVPKSLDSLSKVYFGKDENRIYFKTANGEESIPLTYKPIEKGGYLTILTERTSITLKRFELNYPEIYKPLKEAERDADIKVWMYDRMKKNHEDMKSIESSIKDKIAQNNWGYKTDMNVYPGLLKVGELVRLNFKVKGNIPDKYTVTVEPDYLSVSPLLKRSIDLKWYSNEKGDGFVAESEFKSDRTGNWRVVWQIGEERLSRTFAVVEPGYAVFTLWVGSNRPDIDREIHQYDLPGDYWIGDWWSPFDRPPQEVIDYIRFYAGLRHQYGDRLVPFVNAQWLLPGIPNYNLMYLDETLQFEGLELVKQLWNLLGIGPFEILGSYTLGHKTPGVAQKLGIKAINSLCIWQNWLDGSDANHWKINHWGAPNAPYYAADDDFRKVAQQGQSIVMFSMGTASSVRNYSILTMEAAPTLTCPALRYRPVPAAQSANITRFYDAVDLWLEDAKYQTKPLFVMIGLENFGKRKDWEKANAIGVDYLVQKARNNKIVFASAADIADFYQKHYSRQPEHIYYQPDIYCGYRVGDKPAQIQDRIEISNAQFHTLHVMDRALPQFFWDFTQPWSEPEWSDQPEIRNKSGLVLPELVTAGNCVPRMVNLSDVHVESLIIPEDNGITISLNFDLPHPFAAIPVAVWRLPLSNTDVQVIECSENTRWIKVVDGATDNLHSVIVCGQVLAGQSKRAIRLKGTKREAVDANFKLGNALCGRTLYRDGIPYTYLWRSDGIPPGVLEVNVFKNHPVKVHYNNGQIIEQDNAGKLSIIFNNEWQHEVPLLVGMAGVGLQSLSNFSTSR